MGADTKSCVDVDECEDGSAGCDQRCENVLGSYECECVSNHYQLAEDRKTCNLVDPRAGQLLVSHGHEVCTTQIFAQSSIHFTIGKSKSRFTDETWIVLVLYDVVLKIVLLVVK